jgi:hypothetical protein
MRCCGADAARALDTGSDGTMQQQLEFGSDRTMYHVAVK